MTIALYFQYLQLLITAKFIRGLVQFGKALGRTVGALDYLPPDDHFYVKSKDTKRRIRVNVHYNEAAKRAIREGRPTAVLVSWHGGGFILTNQGEDSIYFRAILSSPSLSDEPLTILDSDYAHGPEDPFPAAVEDGVEVILHVLSNPARYNPTKIIICGFSAGGNIALGTAVYFGKRAIETGHNPIKAVISFYPVADMASQPAGANAKPNPTPSSSEVEFDPKKLPPKYPGMVLNPFFSSLFRHAYFRPPLDLKSKQEQEDWVYKNSRDPLASSLLADVTWFPKHVLLITCEYDTLMPKAERLRRRLESEGNGIIDVRGGLVKGVAHGWDKLSKEGELGWEETVYWNQQCAEFIAELIS